MAQILGDSRLSYKFQVTIPKPVRELLKLQPGDLVAFVKENNQILLKKAEIRIKA